MLDLTAPPYGLAPGTVLARTCDLPRDRALPLNVAGLSILLLAWRGRILAYVNRCPHVGTPLDLVPGHVLSHDGRHLVCATHLALFDPASGLCVRGPARPHALEPVAILVDNEAVLVARASDSP